MSPPIKSFQQKHPHRWDIPALIAVSIVLLGIGLSQPVITVRKLWDSHTMSILSGIIDLWKTNDYILAIIIFFFSILFPIAKLCTLLVIWFMPMPEEHRNRVINGLEILGRWSMLDVFVSAVLVVAVKLGALAAARVEPGIYFFSASIFVAMLAATLQGNLARK